MYVHNPRQQKRRDRLRPSGLTQRRVERWRNVRLAKRALRLRGELWEWGNSNGREARFEGPPSTCQENQSYCIRRLDHNSWPEGSSKSNSYDLNL